MDATREIAEYIVNLSYDRLPSEVIDKTKLLIEDNTSCAIAGTMNSLGKTTIDLIMGLGGKTESTILGTVHRTSSVQAAFVNSVLANSLDYDDVSPGGHPGSTVIPSALALAESRRIPGKDLVTAVVAGYEVSERVSLACEPTVERYKIVHGVGTPQVFGAVAAAGKILGLEVDEMLNALGIAAPWASIPHAGKFGNPLEKGRQVSFVKDNVSRPAEAGLLAAMLAKKGWIGNKSILDGGNGFWVMASSDRFRPEFLSSLDKFRILDVSFKPYPACRWTHTSLDALDELIREHKLDPRKIKKITVASVRALETFGNPKPANLVDAEFSLPYPLTMVAYDVKKSRWYQEENLSSQEYLRFSAEVEVTFDQKAQTKAETHGFEPDFMPSTVHVVTTEDELFSKYKEVPKGNPKNPVSKEEIHTKCLDLITEILGKDLGTRLLEKLKHLEQIEDVSSLSPMFQPN
jgi:2-methylcitrate dehydratase PrpD